jgi:hydrogenase maturation protease
MCKPRILIAGIGNIFLGDDGFGVEVVRRLRMQPIPDHVNAIDFGTRGFDFACALMDSYDTVILVDTVARGGVPGTLYLIEPSLEGLGLSDPVAAMEPHSLDPARVLHYVHAVCGRLPRLRLLGCEPASFGTELAPQAELSPVVAKSVDDAIVQIRELLNEFSNIPESTDECAGSPR